jgi:hypothetical protein
MARIALVSALRPQVAVTSISKELYNNFNLGSRVTQMAKLWAALF